MTSTHHIAIPHGLAFAALRLARKLGEHHASYHQKFCPLC